MSDYYFVEPEVAGGLGEDTSMDRSTHPPKIENLHFDFDGWLGDQLVTSFPCYIATEELSAEFIREGLSGFELASAKITVSEEFKEMHPGLELPKFYWLKIIGGAGKDDFGIAANDWRLVVSKKALALIEPFCPNSIEVEKYAV